MLPLTSSLPLYMRQRPPTRTINTFGMQDIMHRETNISYFTHKTSRECIFFQLPFIAYNFIALLTSYQTNSYAGVTITSILSILQSYNLSITRPQLPLLVAL